MRTASSSTSFWTTALALAGALAFTGCSSETPQSLLAAGQRSEAKKDFKAAILQYKVALQLDPKSADTRLLVGTGPLAAGDPAAAVWGPAKALGQKVPPARVLPALSGALLLVGDYQTLTTCCGDINLDDKPAQAALQVYAGQALPLQKRALALAPGDKAMRLNLAKIALQAGDKTLARAELGRLRALGGALKEQDKVSELMKAI